MLTVMTRSVSFRLLGTFIELVSFLSHDEPYNPG